MNNNKVGAAEKIKPIASDVKLGLSLSATTTIEISIACRQLTNKDVLTKSDPQCVVFHKPISSKTWIQLLKTEVVKNNLNPDFVKKLTLAYRFEQAQYLKFEIYDIDSPRGQLEDQEIIGIAECTAANIVSAGARGHHQALVTSEDRVAGKIILVAEELASLKTEVFLKLCANSLGSCCTSCLMPKSFYTISKINDAKNYLVVHRSKKMKGVNPIWPSLTIGGQSLCNGDENRQLKIEIYRVNLKEEDHFVGSATTTLRQMSQGKDKNGMQLTGPSGAQLNASLSVLACTVIPLFTFVDFVQAGTRIHLCYSIDFTSSNGDPTDPKSLHHISKDPTVTNPYEQAIEATGEVIKDYDNTGVFPVYGFGARTPPTGIVSHDFPVTLSITPNCKGIEGVIRAYRQCIGKVQLFGPTNFAPDGFYSSGVHVQQLSA